MSTDQPNVLFVLTDQQRGDSLGVDPACPRTENGDPLVHTPTLNELAGKGTQFRRAYTPISSSIPARRCLWTGQTPATNGCPNWTTEPWDFERTLPATLTDAGYQTRLVGKTHSLPQRNHFGFEHLELHAGLRDDDDYDEWLAEQTTGNTDEISHGVGRNSWDARPWHLPETQHPTNWTTDRAIEFVEKRDPTRPFFLTVSYVRPHQPYDPPQPYWDRYDRRDDIPSPAHGEWTEEQYRQHVPDHPRTDAWCADLPTDVDRAARVGYYGSVTHVDHQINRLFRQLFDAGVLDDTIIVFTADHGDMLGDHLLWRKCYAFEGAARVPLLLQVPGLDQQSVVAAPVGLEDIMPTLLSLCDVAIPDSVRGIDLSAVARGAATDDELRSYYHHEHGPIYHDTNAYQSLVGSRWKYVWNPVTGDELLFDLESDPLETVDRSDERDETVGRLRETLVDRIGDRRAEFDAPLPA